MVASVGCSQTNRMSREDMRKFTLTIIYGIAKKYDGEIEIIGDSYLTINVPEEHEAACAREMEERVGDWCG